MATTITGKLNKPAREFQAGDSTGFGVNVGKQYYDRETKQKEWTNYEAAFFSSNDSQIGFMRSVLVEGAVIEITSKEEKIKSFDGNNGPVLSIQLLDCSLGYVHTGQSQQSSNAPQQAPMQQAPQQAPVEMGYYWADGSPMAPNDAQFYINNGTPKWVKGTQPPQ